MSNFNPLFSFFFSFFPLNLLFYTRSSFKKILIPSPEGEGGDFIHCRIKFSGLSQYHIIPWITALLWIFDFRSGPDPESDPDQFPPIRIRIQSKWYGSTTLVHSVRYIWHTTAWNYGFYTFDCPCRVYYSQPVANTWWRAGDAWGWSSSPSDPWRRSQPTPEPKIRYRFYFCV